jgi:diazepam-binding inhibitor (GABA receptor modulator, acyl-CoA-binding protein)
VTLAPPARPRAMLRVMTTTDRTGAFADAQQRVNALTRRPSNEELLELYGLYKQATAGDATGTRPGMIDFKGRAKFDAWTRLKGTAREDAMDRYVALVDRLVAKLG